MAFYILFFVYIRIHRFSIVCTIFSRLANSGESIQHVVGYNRSGVNMKPIRASVYHEARLNMQSCCVNQFNRGHVMSKNISGSSSNRSRLQRWSHHRQVHQFKSQHQPMSFLSAMASIQTMLPILSIWAFYLLFFTNTIQCVAGNSLTGNGGTNGAVTGLPTTTEFGESHNFSSSLSSSFFNYTDATEYTHRHHIFFSLTDDMKSLNCSFHVCVCVCYLVFIYVQKLV